ncbi:hypothetical protein ACH5RR_031322 [Cinchona calisaya]|uniref:N-acetyltransferase domain-containing protein n=1 Tax=Cinchona calisaya TaxID=153742 RepID=A0ABD2YEW9_9GENT
MDKSRISIRPFTLSDAEDFFTWASDDKVTKYLRWNTINSKEEALKYIQEVAIPQLWRRSICLDYRSIGYISIKPESGCDKHRAHVGYGIGVEFWGQGIVTEALKIAISSVFKELPYLVRLEALVEEENKGSQKVLEKIGFVKEGFLRKYGFNKGEIKDMFIYSFLVTDENVAREFPSRALAQVVIMNASVWRK